ncbi:hypothetical protein [Neolewinella antarctica]|uniref:Lipocalin-like domain-containing protein n=1 Tax=Neolewinella antarctica TaxID=442734 RepID=A0ABX0XB41_9BACT|nr:hypothetical protein [Neolewinella antarctica]NJC26486.1 hypothetical protein [Neolewinella antarctica]
MRFSNLSLLFALPIFLASCEADPAPATAPKTESDISTTLLGTWETVEVDVIYRTYENRDTSFQQVIREADWGRLFGVRPARTEFMADGKHKRTHTLTSGQVADVTNGLWKVQSGDSLLIIEPNKTFYYAHELTGDRLVLTGVVDYDYDGEADDEYRSVMRLVSRTK